METKLGPLAVFIDRKHNYKGGMGMWYSVSLTITVPLSHPSKINIAQGASFIVPGIFTLTVGLALIFITISLEVRLWGCIFKEMKGKLTCKNIFFYFFYLYLFLEKTLQFYKFSFLQLDHDYKTFHTAHYLYLLISPSIPFNKNILLLSFSYRLHR